MESGPPRKRLKTNSALSDSRAVREKRAAFLNSITRSISPPSGGPLRSVPTRPQTIAPTKSELQLKTQSAESNTPERANQSARDRARSPQVVSTLETAAQSSMDIPSPIQLTKIQDLPESQNIDTLTLHDILGDPLIKEAWIFNFCFDVEWVMEHFDSDIRDLVKVKIVHGSWRREDTNKIAIDDACSRRPNVDAIQAYLPDAFGTHHSKMFILFRHDEQAQVIIHTANMLSRDWANMTQAVWRSPFLPLKQPSAPSEDKLVGSGPRFKHDLLRYIRAYGSKLKSLLQQIQQYDFTQVRGALVASVPSKFPETASDDEAWGHEALKRITRQIPAPLSREMPHFIYQVSSIATLPDKWLQSTFDTATGCSTPISRSIVFPTDKDVASSLDGYLSGVSIHTKAQSAAHLRQIANLRPHLCKWASNYTSPGLAGRHEAAPHIKTFIRLSATPSNSNPKPTIDWALITSANLSTQAWGTTAKIPKTKNASSSQAPAIHIQSFEIGVIIWPALYKQSDEDEPIMVPVFKTNKELGSADSDTSGGTRVHFRMPYDLPLAPYQPTDQPWSRQSTYTEPDRFGRRWTPNEA